MTPRQVLLLLRGAVRELRAAVRANDAPRALALCAQLELALTAAENRIGVQNLETLAGVGDTLDGLERLFRRRTR